MLHAAMRDGRVPTEGVKVCEFFASVRLGVLFLCAEAAHVHSRLVPGWLCDCPGCVCTRASRLALSSGRRWGLLVNHW